MGEKKENRKQELFYVLVLALVFFLQTIALTLTFINLHHAGLLGSPRLRHFLSQILQLLFSALGASCAIHLCMAMRYDAMRCDAMLH